MLWKGANSSGKCSSTEVSYSALHCRGAHYVDASTVLLTVAKHHSAQSITDEGRFKFSFRALTRIIKRVKLLGISSSLLAICTTACSLLQSKCLFTGCYFLSGVFGEKKLKQTSHYRLLCWGGVWKICSMYWLHNSLEWLCIAGEMLGESSHKGDELQDGKLLWGLLKTTQQTCMF